MKKRNLLWMVVCLVSFFIFIGCSSTDNEGFEDEPEVLAEVEEAIDDELGDDEGFGDDDFDDSAGSDFDDEGFDDEGPEASADSDFDDEGFEDEGSSEDTADSELEDEGFGDDEGFGEEAGETVAANAGEDEFDEVDDGFDEEVPATDDEFADFDNAEQSVAEPVNQDEAFEDTIEEPVAAAVAQQPVNEPDIEDEFTDNVGAISNSITSIDFKSSEGGSGVILIKTSEASTITQRQNIEQRQMIIDIFNTTVPSHLKRPFIMKDFAGTPFAGLNVYSQEDGSTVSAVIQMKPGMSMPAVQQEGNSILAMASGAVVQPVVDNNQVMDKYMPAAPMQKGIMSANNFYEFLLGTTKYYGKPISIQANNVNIRDLLNFISEESGANIIVSQKVEGEISLKLRDVPWDQALVTIMKSNGLGYVREGTVLRIDTLQELEQIAQSIKRTHENISQLKPDIVKTYAINYADPEQLKTNLDQILTPKKGKAVIDKRTNLLIVTDSDDVHSKISKVIQLIDVKPKQVVIESKIVEARDSFVQDIGVRWGATNGASVLDKSGGPFGSPVLMRPRIEMNSSSIDQVASAASLVSLSIGTLKSLGDLTASLALSENENLTKILSQPRIVAMNKETAEIIQKTEVLTITNTVNEGTITEKVERTPVELKLEVTPQITNNNDILMDFYVTRGFAGPTESIRTLARAVNKREAKSKVIVKNGETAVIGGIYDSLGLVSETGPVGLKDIPILGWLFKSKKKEKIKNELLIFLTPRVMGLDNEV